MVTANFFLSLMTAIFAGVLAFKAFGNRKPVMMYAKQAGGETAPYILNPNREHHVFIMHIINEVGEDGLSIALAADPWPERGSSQTNEVSKMETSPEIKLDAVATLGQRINPGERCILVIFSDKDPKSIIPARFTVERDSFNYFSAAPIFNVIIRPYSSSFTKTEKVERRLRKYWHRWACRHRALDD